MSRHILITGVSSGLGYGLAKHYLSTGSRVYGMSRRKPDDLCAREGFSFESVDFKEPEEAARATSKLLSSVESLDLVLLNAGMLNGIKDMADTSVAEIEEVMRVNVWANKVLLDVLFSAGIAVKQVIGISSGASKSGSRGWNAYSLSKAALDMLMNLYAKEQTNTHFLAFAPGTVDTAMQDYLCGLPEDERFPVVDRLKKARGTEAMPTPEEIAPRLVEAFKQIKAHPSGSFVDIREL